MYETENQTLPYAFDEHDVPPPGGYAGDADFDDMGWWWFNFIEGFYEKSDSKRTVVKCPSKNLYDNKLKNNILCGNYGVNVSICKSSQGPRSRAEFIGIPLKTSNIRRACETILITDCGYSMISWWNVTDEPPVALGNDLIRDAAYIPGLFINEEKELWPGQEEDAIFGRHLNKTVNIGFADGHVAREKADDLFVEKTGDNYRKKSPLWVPK